MTKKEAQEYITFIQSGGTVFGTYKSGYRFEGKTRKQVIRELKKL